MFVSHDLDEAMKLGTHIAIMESGRIVQYGQPEEIVLKPASAYVADFVAHMNPLERAARRLADDAGGRRSRGAATRCCSTPRRMATLDAKGRPTSVTDRRQARPPGGVRGRRRSPAPSTTWSSRRPADIKLRTALELRHQTGNPVALVEDGRLIGVIGDDEIYRGILRQTEHRGLRPVLVIDQDRIDAVLTWPALVDALDAGHRLGRGQTHDRAARGGQRHPA